MAVAKVGKASSICGCTSLIRISLAFLIVTFLPSKKRARLRARPGGRHILQSCCVLVRKLHICVETILVCVMIPPEPVGLDMVTLLE
ncbi:hypothetical protein QBC44DRAFT_323210 [Cladorrhinum sp. PSN332]|nr:hypothetical protein QBC44DRAFT_323210 [Cladorrhinum sp. PSN332]